MNPTDKMMAWAQIGLSVLFIFGTFFVIGAYELGYAKFQADQAKDFSSTMNWLTGACLIIIYFWFQRQRTNGIPDSSNLVTQSHTAPDGSKTTVTSPLNAPAAAVPSLGAIAAAVAHPSSATPGDANVPNKPSPIPGASLPLSPIGSDSRI
jgi:hypothetical protein